MPRSIRHHLPLFLLIPFFFLIPTPSFSAPNPNVAALFTWIKSGSSPSSFPDWNPSDATPCNWTGIACDSTGSVSSITISSVPLAIPLPFTLCSAIPSLSSLSISASNLTGAIPSSLSSCRRLVFIDLSFNSLSGAIPDSLFRLPSLHSLILNSNSLSGQIPSSLGEATALHELLLYDNRLSGTIPDSVGNLTGLEIFRAGGNLDISGSIPASFSQCRRLSVLGLADTRISGNIPASIGRLANLQTLSIYTAMLSGAIPPELGNCSALTNLFLYENSLSGQIPAGFGRLFNLQRLLLWQNSLSGFMPEQFGNLSSLQIVDLSINSISGEIPSSVGGLSNLEEFMLSDNNISGSIPPSLSNLTSLSQLQLDTNQISGLIPPELGELSSLILFFAWQNQLEGRIPSSFGSLTSLQALDLSHNHLTGGIPPGIFLLRNLTKLMLLSNDISGFIPPEIGQCRSLVRLRLGSNSIGGSIPSQIGDLAGLNFLDLSGNRLTGTIPIELGNCSQLQMLNASWNQFTGPIPESLGKLVSMNKLILEGNFLSGQIPSSLGRCSSLELLDLSNNGLTGAIPSELCEIGGLDIALNLSRNTLTGPIPETISALSKLSVLDLSYNNLVGSLIPLGGLENLIALNVSNNNFTGNLPDTKLFHQLSLSDLAGNEGLCTQDGDVCFVSTDPNAITANESRKLHKLKLAIALLITATVAMVLGMLGVIQAKRMGGGKAEDEIGSCEKSWPWQFTPFQKLNFSVEQVVGSLVDTNIIGKGCSGIVYKVRMDNGEAIAVKKLWPSTGGTRVRDSFSAEVQTLGTIRHKNIVRFLGCCRNRSTRLLMYDYMENGSLGGLLHESNGCPLEWDLRYRIILGAAQGLAYLHHDCVPPIVHRDIKANNILIGLDFEPYIADFGLAKLVEEGEFAQSSNTVAGSFGYIAPEYGYMLKITEKSDVYSYGVVLLEVLTGKQPIDPTIPDGLHVADWVRMKKGCSEVLDISLRLRPDLEVEEMLQAVGVALLCVNSMPDERPTMKDVAAMLKEIRLEREEYAKVDALLKASPPAPLQSRVPALNATTSATSVIVQSQQGHGSISASNHSSFSTGTFFSSSKAKSPF
ncbi:Receptor-like protein kinase 2 [Platanthera zijinensis]|uniref:Receptor-like protein kinase 2 n=1 Tax=Platanthera zijinensis TaxID=2320716 RepID=A0AAP0BEH1_9ASPA